jgi:hypothetical protein
MPVLSHYCLARRARENNGERHQPPSQQDLTTVALHALCRPRGAFVMPSRRSPYALSLRTLCVGASSALVEKERRTEAFRASDQSH